MHVKPSDWINESPFSNINTIKLEVLQGAEACLSYTKGACSYLGVGLSVVL